jgi:hypothetical protein
VAVWLILASAFLHAFWNARLKRQAEMGVAGSPIFLVAGLNAQSGEELWSADEKISEL